MAWPVATKISTLLSRMSSRVAADDQQGAWEGPGGSQQQRAPAAVAAVAARVPAGKEGPAATEADDQQASDGAGPQADVLLGPEGGEKGAEALPAHGVSSQLFGLAALGAEKVAHDAARTLWLDAMRRVRTQHARYLRPEHVSS